MAPAPLEVWQAAIQRLNALGNDGSSNRLNSTLSMLIKHQVSLVDWCEMCCQYPALSSVSIMHGEVCCTGQPTQSCSLILGKQGSPSALILSSPNDMMSLHFMHVFRCRSI